MDGTGPDLDRLRERALREQWSLEDLDWSLIDRELRLLPEPIRQAGAAAFAQLHWGEHTAHVACLRLEHLASLSPIERDLCAAQATDEARHAAFFLRGMRALDRVGTVRPSVSTLMREVEAAPTAEALVLGMQILIEGVAHSLFTEAGRIFADVDESNALMRAPKQLMGEWLPKLLARDESRHIAFGLTFLRERIPGLSRAARDDLEQRLARWGAIVVESCAEPDIVEGAGVDPRVLCTALIDDLNLRIRQVGLETRI